VKSGFNPDAVLADLYRLTPLEDNFTINAVALVDGAPKTLGLRELLQVFLDHRVEVIRRRSAFRLTKARNACTWSTACSSRSSTSTRSSR
jgi:DNA gyrase subunit A